MSQVCSLADARLRSASVIEKNRRITQKNRFALAMRHISEEDKGLIYNLVHEYGLTTVCHMLESQINRQN